MALSPYSAILAAFVLLRIDVHRHHVDGGQRPVVGVGKRFLKVEQQGQFGVAVLFRLNFCKCRVFWASGFQLRIGYRKPARIEEQLRALSDTCLHGFLL